MLHEPSLPPSTSLSHIGRPQAVIAGERRILEMIATGVSLSRVLDAIALLFEEQADGVRASILRIENSTTMRPGAAPSLPAAYLQEIDGLIIGINVGSCGTAAFTRQRVIVEDIEHDPRWADCKTGALALGLRACWSTPVLDRDGVVLGTFGIYYLERRGPSQAELDLADHAVHLASIALERQRADLRMQLMHEQLEEQIRMRTEQLQRAVSQLIEAREAAEAASAAKSSFLANVSHEIRTPLNAVLGFAQLLAGASDLSPSHTEHVRAIQSGGEHLLSLINGVLEMSKIESGHVSVTQGELAPRKLLADLERMFRLPAQQKALELRMSLGSEVPAHIVSDEGKLRQVLINLMGNALKFTAQGRVELRVFSEPGDLAHELRVWFEVEDTGPGIPEQVRSEIFEPFVQAGSSEQRAGGTGLGLAISKRFVERLGGRIGVQSCVGAGSTFRFDIVAQRARDSARLKQRPTVAPPAPQPLRSGPILVVDDSALNRRLMREILEPLGFAVMEAENGLDALNMYAAHSPALVLMDIRMPVMDGHEAMRRIRAEHGAAGRIVAVTASVFEEDVPDIMESGADEVLRKPFRNDSLLSMVERQLNLPQPLPRE
jgi:signal transduction histidine kinase